MKFFILLLAASLPIQAAFSSCTLVTQYHSQVSALSDPNYPNGIDIDYTAPQLRLVANGGFVTNASGHDIVFSSDSAGASPLNWDAFSLYDGTIGRIVTHVAITLSNSVDTTFYMCAGNNSISTFQGGAKGAAWSADAIAVYHFGTMSSAVYTDATVNANDGTNTSTTAVPAIYAGGISFNGTSTHVNVANSTSLNPTNVSWSVAVKPSLSNLVSNSQVFNKGGGGSTPFGKYYFVMNGSGSLTTNSCVVGTSDNASHGATLANIVYGAWQVVGCSYDSATGILTSYINGIPQNTITISGTKTLVTNTGILEFGAQPSFPLWWSGLMDELRLWNTVRTQDEFITEARNYLFPTEFYSVGWTCCAASLPPVSYVLDSGTYPFFYRDQFTGINGWANTGATASGDTPYVTWDSTGTQYITFNDGQGFVATGGIGGAGGCGASGANAGMGTVNLSGTVMTKVNCMTSMGTTGQQNTGGWGDGYTWKSSGIAAINDGSTTTGLYWDVFRQLDTAPPWTKAYSSIMFSADGGVTWCAPGHTGGSCNTNGDAPANNTGEFNSNFMAIQFVQIEKGNAGTVNVDCNSTYIYAYGGDASNTNWILGRVARGTNLQTAASWSFYIGAAGGDACNNANWQASSAGATVLLLPASANLYPSFIYISGFGYLCASITSPSDTVSFFSSSKVTGPWINQFVEAPAANIPKGNGAFGNGVGGSYGFIQPLLSSVTAIPPFGWSVANILTGTYLSAGVYAPFIRKLYITPGTANQVLK